MRTCALVVVLVATFVAACGDNGGAQADRCANAPDGTSCGAGQICRANACVNSRCGDDFVAAGEECDDGNAADGDGCEANCRFTCLASDAARNCTPADACAGQGVCSAAHTCTAGTPLLNGTPCDAGGGTVCISGACTSTLCGNGTVDDGEDCDDRNVANLDGCDSACKFEQAARITSLQQQFVPDAFCAKNALGEAIPASDLPFGPRQLIQFSWNSPVTTGDLSVVFKFLGTIDTTGARSTFKLGFVDTTPVRFNQDPDTGMFGDSYSGVTDLDWWYTLRDPAHNTSVDLNRTPRVQLAGEVTNRHVTAGPGTIDNLRLLFALEPANVRLFNANIDATFDDQLSNPTVSTTATPPGHLASEQLSSSFSTFQSSGIIDMGSPGRMCADVSAQSLANTLFPTLLAACRDPVDPTGATATFFRNPDNDNDPLNNHLLDAFIFGCQFFSFDASGNPAFVTEILPTQPDGSIDGSTYVFGVDAATHQVKSCTKDGNPETLANCYANATYSSYFQFAADRVIIRADMPAVLPSP